MLGTSQKVYVLVEALLYIAYHKGARPLGGKSLASTLDVSPRYLEPLLQALVRSGILRSTRGPRGGYMLARERRMVRMDEVWTAIAHDKANIKESFKFSEENQKLVQPLFAHAYNAFMDALGCTTLEDLCMQAQKHAMDHVFIGSEPHTQPKLDYSI